MRLLGSDRKISQIAGEVGFSTTAYYRKYFTKWFGHDPQKHRDLYNGAIKSDLNPAVFRDLPQVRTVSILREAYASYDPHQAAGFPVELKETAAPRCGKAAAP